MIRYYQDYISEDLFEILIKPELKEVIPGLSMKAQPSGLETPEALSFLLELYKDVREDLKLVLERREEDRSFIDARVKAIYQYNTENEIDLHDENYQTILGLKDQNGRTVIGPLSDYKKANTNKVAPIPEHLEGVHVTLFGPPGKAKMSINAMNAYHRRLKEEPSIVAEILEGTKTFPKWGADDEDSKTPLHSDLTEASSNLSECFRGTIEVKDAKKHYKLAEDHLSLPIKRFPGLALPSPFMFHHDEPMPMHLYDFALHFFHHWDNPEALTFYVPKLENEEEAAYIKKMFETAELMIQKEHPEYKLGTIRCIIVLENPRAVFRVNELMDELYPYFVGASLGWHDYLGSTARLLKEDGNYRIPVKADPDIVIKYIKASHELLSDVVGERGGIKIGGMYGILPLENDLFSDSFQMTIRGYIRDVVTQMKRNLSGFWVAHPDFVRIGIALVEAWKSYEKGVEEPLKKLVSSLLKEDYAAQVWDFIKGDDIEGLDKSHHRYDRSLIVADIKESTFIANNHPDEIRYNVFQSLQYITDWLTGNGCVALPAIVDGVSVRVMDDLATAERSRWEVWHELYHGRFSLEEFIRIVHEEMHFIRKDLSHSKKIVQVKYSEDNAKWYEAAVNIMLKLMTDENPAEFATELLLPFTIEEVRNSEHPWELVLKSDPLKFKLRDDVEKYHYYFENCGCDRFAKVMSSYPIYDEKRAEEIIMNFTQDEIIQAASFHGNIGESRKTLDLKAASEQSQVEENLQETLLAKGQAYLEKFGFKFLISAQGKGGNELLEAIEQRMENLKEEELLNARKALFEITHKRIQAPLKKKLINLFNESNVKGLQLGLTLGKEIQTLCFGEEVKEDSKLQIASLSKTVGSAFAIETFSKHKIQLIDSVNETFKKLGSDFGLNQDCEIQHLMQHTALNMHYVNGFKSIPPISELLDGSHGYEPVKVINLPGSIFKYSGAGFIVLENLLNLLLKKDVRDEIDHWLGDIDLTLNQSSECLSGYRDDGETVQLQFPAIAAGGVGSSKAMLQFLERMTDNQYRDMFFGRDLGSMDFMGAKIGLGTFVAEAGANRFCLHQGANDGFRALYLYCFEGPNKGFGVSLFSQGELNSVYLISRITQVLLEHFNIQGIDFEKFKSAFATDHLVSEEIVNKGYKELVFNAFERDRAEEITYARERHSHADKNLLLDAEVLAVSTDKFARIENLISPYEPQFDPAHFGRQGKIMDSWETPRHNLASYDFARFKLKKISSVLSVEISTKYHLGNQVESIEILDNKDRILLPKTRIKGHSLLIRNIKPIDDVDEIEVRVFPDGGLTRLALYDFTQEEKDITFDEPIPQTLKPLALDYRSLPASKRDNLADYTLGARVMSASDEHYAPAESILSPLLPLSMFDGFESARSRVEGHYEEVVIQLAKMSDIGMIEFDFTYFVNNNPLYLSLEGKTREGWESLIDKDFTKPFAGKIKKYSVESSTLIDQLKIKIFPDGGFNRIRVYAKTD